MGVILSILKILLILSKMNLHRLAMELEIEITP